MPWGWKAPKEGTDLGGSIGTYAEAATPGAWPDYEAQHLAKMLRNKSNTLKHGGHLGDAEKHIYLERASEKYKEEAERCLKAEFKQWLEGRHKDNVDPQPYVNGDGKPRRREVYEGEVGSLKGGWKPTWWEKKQLTHLPGVREWLRAQETHNDNAEFVMNVLAEHGPQNLEQAWAYFKHWVKGRPVSDECHLEGSGEVGTRSDMFNQLPRGFMDSKKEPPSRAESREPPSRAESTMSTETWDSTSGLAPPEATPATAAPSTPSGEGLALPETPATPAPSTTGYSGPSSGYASATPPGWPPGDAATEDEYVSAEDLDAYDDEMSANVAEMRAIEAQEVALEAEIAAEAALLSEAQQKVAELAKEPGPSSASPDLATAQAEVEHYRGRHKELTDLQKNLQRQTAAAKARRSKKEDKSKSARVAKTQSNRVEAEGASASSAAGKAKVARAGRDRVAQDYAVLQCDYELGERISEAADRRRCNRNEKEREGRNREAEEKEDREDAARVLDSIANPVAGAQYAQGHRPASADPFVWMF